ncbi:hypothetical protein Tco_1143528 [Tanacetum coccineum]
MESRRSPENTLAVGGQTVKIMLLLDRFAAAVGLYHIHAAGRSQKEPVGPAVELHHKKKGCVSCWAVRVGLADCIGPDEWSGIQNGKVVVVYLPRPWMPNGDIGGGRVRLDVSSREKREGGRKIKEMFKERKAVIPY